MVEVVNTHEMEPETRQAYKTAGYKVDVVWVAWDSVARLLKGIQVEDGTLGFPDRLATATALGGKSTPGSSSRHDRNGRHKSNGKPGSTSASTQSILSY